VNADRDPDPTIEPMAAKDWPDVRRIYAEGIATGDATLEREAPDWNHFDHSHPTECRLVARDVACAVVGWTALGGYSSRNVYTGVAWESVYVAERAPARGRASPARGLIPASEAAGYWTLPAGVLAENARSLRGRWRDVVLPSAGVP
jgi:L-amino acid N-acyltransferase YncA